MSCCVFGIYLCMFCVSRSFFLFHSYFVMRFVIFSIFIFACRRTILVYSLPITLCVVVFVFLCVARIASL